MESQPQNPEFRNNPENFHPCVHSHYSKLSKFQTLVYNNREEEKSKCSNFEHFCNEFIELFFFFNYSEKRDTNTPLKKTVKYSNR